MFSQLLEPPVMSSQVLKCPKDSNLTTIGLPKRKKANIIPFLNMPFQNKQTKF
jgi:hypothetical protein